MTCLVNPLQKQPPQPQPPQPQHTTTTHKHNTQPQHTTTHHNTPQHTKTNNNPVRPRFLPYMDVSSCARSTPMHDAHNSWSDTGRVQGPTGRRCTKGGVSGPAEDLRPVSEVEAGVNFRPAGGGTGAGCRFTSQEATRHRNQASQGRCGHTFRPPRGSWYPIRVTWIRIGHPAINGLDEGV